MKFKIEITQDLIFSIFVSWFIIVSGTVLIPLFSEKVGYVFTLMYALSIAISAIYFPSKELMKISRKGGKK